MWNDRYASTDLLWSSGPNRFVEEQLTGLDPGRALDLGAGEGRNAMWLAQNGWQVTAVDFAEQLLSRKDGRWPKRRTFRSTWVVEDLLNFRPRQASFDLVLLTYIHLRQPEFSRMLSMACSALAAKGTLLVIGHDATNIEHGVGGPQDPSVLYTSDDILLHLRDMDIAHAGIILRPVTVDGKDLNAIDVMVRAVKR